MDVSKILSELDAEIARLQAAREALAGLRKGAKPLRGRPKGSKNVAPVGTKPAKRTMSPEGRKRVAEAQRKRWAALKKAKQ